MPWLTIIKWVGGVVAGLLIAWGLYAGLIRPTTKPNPSTHQSGGVSYNITTPRQTFGCTNIKIQRMPNEEMEITESNSISSVNH